MLGIMGCTGFRVCNNQKMILENREAGAQSQQAIVTFTMFALSRLWMCLSLRAMMPPDNMIVTVAGSFFQTYSNANKVKLRELDSYV